MRNRFYTIAIGLFALLLLYPVGSAGGNTVPVKPITGTWINLAYQDVRNKYTNPRNFDNTDPEMWEQKVKELADMGMEYLVFMAVANEDVLGRQKESGGCHYGCGRPVRDESFYEYRLGEGSG